MDSTRLKVAATVVILTVGAVLGCLVSFSDDSEAKQSDGLMIDFGNYDTKWVSARLDSYDDSLELLEYCCNYLGYSLTVTDGTVVEVNGVFSDGARGWDFWTTNGSGWEKRGSDSSPDGYTVVAWAYCSDGEVPAPAVDSMGNSIMGYPRAMRVVSLSPSITEIMGSLNAVTTIVGADMYSDYPHSVDRAQDEGTIAVTGGYINPSFEKIVACNPDIVICDGSQYSHAEMCEKLNRYGIASVITYDGTDIDAIKNNIYLVGQVTGYDIAARNVISDISDAMRNISYRIMSDPSHKNADVLLTLSGDKAPFASGDNTYADDTLEYVSGMNVITKNGWVHISSEIIAKSNPGTIIIVSSSYSDTDEDYNALISNLSDEWKSTDAYKNGRIYLLCEDASDLAQRSSPRVVQLMELLGRILQPDVFTDIDLPMHIGSNYSDYLTYTKNYSYDN